jgi:hypothetical protein
MTKKETSQWLKAVGCSSSYSGNNKIMFVHGITQEILDGYGLETNGFTLKAD